MPTETDPKITVPLVRLSDLRGAHGLSLRDVCDRLEVHGVTLDPGFLSRVERGQRRLSPRTLKALAAVYRLKAVDIYQPEVPPADRVRPPRRRGEASHEDVPQDGEPSPRAAELQAAP